MKRKLWLPLILLTALGLSGCSTFFEGGIVFGAPTVLVSRANLSAGPETDFFGNVVYVYRYDLVFYALPGSGAGTVVLLDAAGDPVVDDAFLIPQACPPSSQDPCGPYTYPVEKRSPTPLSPVQAVKYKTVAANGQSKVVSLPVPLALY